MRARHLAAALALAASPTLVSVGAAGATGRGDVVTRHVTFTVQNLDRTALGPTELETCPAHPDQQGATWTVDADLVAPQRAVHGHDTAVTVYLHGLGLGGDAAFRSDAAPGLDFARAEALAGHASLVVDRIGYGDSTRPDGTDVCTGAQADVLHQVVQQLRNGMYGGPAFDHVALAGHSAGGLVAEIEAYTFHDIDALAVLAYADQGFTPYLGNALGQHASACAAGPPSGYAPTFDDTKAAWLSSDADPRVVTAVAAAHVSDPCGENPLPYIGSNPAQLANVTVPVLLVYGADDALFDPATASTQASHFGSTDVTTIVMPHTAHLLMLEASAPVLQSKVDTWLRAHRL